MGSRRILRDTVSLNNYIGEVNDVATYQETILEHCYCPHDLGISANTQGKKATDGATLYIFEKNTRALSPEGYARTFVDSETWEALEDKSPYWTLCDNGRDFIKVDGSNLRVTSLSHKVAGSRRMWHYKVAAK